jgi:hypothetical protein
MLSLSSMTRFAVLPLLLFGCQADAPPPGGGPGTQPGPQTPGTGTPNPGTPAAGGATLSGKVVDFATLAPVPNITVQVSNGTSATSGADGSYSLPNVPTGVPVVIAVQGMPGGEYTRVSSAHTLPAAATATANLTAMKTAALLDLPLPMGVQRNPQLATVILSLHRGQGKGRDGIPVAGVTFNPPLTGATNAFAYNQQNQIVTTTALDKHDRALIYFFNVQANPAPVTASVTYLQDNDGQGGGGGGGGNQLKTAQFQVTTPGEVVWVNINKPITANYYDGEAYAEGGILFGCQTGGGRGLWLLLIALSILTVRRIKRS